MKIHEFTGKKLLREYGINIPQSQLIIDKIPEKRLIPSVAKSQVLVGGRMKAGGVLFIKKEDEYTNTINELQNKEIKGELPYGILVEELINIKKEYYISILIDREDRDIKWVFSYDGGIEIESSENIIKGTYNEVFLKAPRKIKEIMPNLYNLFIEKDLTLLEINPIVETQDDEIYALDCVMHVDDNAIYRQKWSQRFLEKTDYNFHYVELEGDIGVIGCGAGIVMATMDTVSNYGLKPANFLDIGGGADKETTLKALNLLKDKGIKNIVMNIFGGITQCDIIAQSIVEFEKKNEDIKLFIRLTGTNEEKGNEILSENNLKNYEDMDTMIKALKGYLRELEI
ncbi:succinate--CoA ligase subunit beta [Oceanotoga sp. DSM 15011]|uniref:succinate--CoA ligase subunit beta n=1 Tax=unclassified Oceanotoga TaxID=2618448 RepID=UPI0021F4FC2A|nr:MULTISPECIES: succinate--CoA ligase subunit beta [unclassified Oceanotoga]MDN5341697.1 succinyl-CoA synthetase beta subunit [Oceanotoga sp.]UYO98867.1 succinate--CoA ligase subunit beta [Oceanotoga sp. DSM 15011]